MEVGSPSSGPPRGLSSVLSHASSVTRTRRERLEKDEGEGHPMGSRRGGEGREWGRPAAARRAHTLQTGCQPCAWFNALEISQS